MGAEWKCINLNLFQSGMERMLNSTFNHYYIGSTRFTFLWFCCAMHSKIPSPQSTIYITFTYVCVGGRKVHAVLCRLWSSRNRKFCKSKQVLFGFHAIWAYFFSDFISRKGNVKSFKRIWSDQMSQSEEKAKRKAKENGIRLRMGGRV